MRMRKWFCVVLLAGCTVQSSPQPQYGYRQPRQYPQRQPEPPPPQPEPAVVVYQPPATTYHEPIGPLYIDVNFDLEGQSVPSIDVFYNELAPYGSWYDDKTFGWVFAPS